MHHVMIWEQIKRDHLFLSLGGPEKWEVPGSYICRPKKVGWKPITSSVRVLPTGCNRWAGGNGLSVPVTHGRIGQACATSKQITGNSQGQGMEFNFRRHEGYEDVKVTTQWETCIEFMLFCLIFCQTSSCDHRNVSLRCTWIFYLTIHACADRFEKMNARQALRELDAINLTSHVKAAVHGSRCCLPTTSLSVILVSDLKRSWLDSTPETPDVHIFVDTF